MDHKPAYLNPGPKILNPAVAHLPALNLDVGRKLAPAIPLIRLERLLGQARVEQQLGLANL